MEVAKALGGSFKFVMLVPKTLREMTHCSEGSYKTKTELFLKHYKYHKEELRQHYQHREPMED